MKYLKKFNENKEYTDNLEPFLRDGYKIIKVDNIDKVRDKSKIIYLNKTTAEYFSKLADLYAEKLIIFKRMMTATDYSIKYYSVDKDSVGPEYKLYYVDRNNLEYKEIKRSNFIQLSDLQKNNLYYILPDKVESVKGAIESYKELLKLYGEKIETVAQMTKLLKQKNDNDNETS